MFILYRKHLMVHSGTIFTLPHKVALTCIVVSITWKMFHGFQTIHLKPIDVAAALFHEMVTR